MPEAAPVAFITSLPSESGRGSGAVREAVRPAGVAHRLWSAGNQLLMALLLWLALAGVVYALDPAAPWARPAFFTALFGALFFTLSPLIRGISLQFSSSRLYQEAVGLHAARQALMLSTLVVLNGLLQVQRAWTPLTALLLCSVFAIIEIVALARR
jgi:hypothetical protein